ncbi:MAG: hypothetical protein A2Y24_02910 [Clostridiales bacterium GWE2_32_10]|nr:MAG: hypothetical protein A2Y24_02910 [Clostridiales bacterium GWE2_32_10]HBY19553.1 hypothetical protein [Clostridiales bacterium]
MDNIVYDVMIGIVILVFVVIIINISNSSSDALKKGSYVRDTQENSKYNSFKYDEYIKYSHESRELTGAEILAFVRYHETNVEISEIDIEKYSSSPGSTYLQYKYDSADDYKQRQSKIKLIEEYINANFDSDKTGLLEAKYRISYDEITKKITFLLINNHT